ncbi:MAG: aminotransferase class I/II-fold pyridoxal phosphate-dependent enzyme [Pseudomonadota bacterium]
MTPRDRFDMLPQVTWPRLRALLDPHAPGGEAINMTIGEPRHAFPEWLPEAIAEHAHLWRKYPDNNGLMVLRESIANWLVRRYGVKVDPETQLMALNGTREGLYGAAAALAHKPGGAVLIPNPFYPVYEVAALSVGAEPIFMNATAATGHLPDFDSLDAATLDRVSIAYICSPANPQGVWADRSYWERLMALAERHDFYVFADECYAEIYRGAPPVGVLEVAQAISANPNRVVAFHSLSKRSNVAGLRSGFVVSGQESMARIKRLRAFAGAPLPEPIQMVSARLWSDESHVVANRSQYLGKFEAADHIFATTSLYIRPEAGFFLWLPTDDGERAALDLWQQTGVRVLPGTYLAREAHGENPGRSFIRVALVADQEEAKRGMEQIRACLFEAG